MPTNCFSGVPGVLGVLSNAGAGLRGTPGILKGVPRCSKSGEKPWQNTRNTFQKIRCSYKTRMNKGWNTENTRNTEKKGGGFLSVEVFPLRWRFSIVSAKGGNPAMVQAVSVASSADGRQFDLIGV